MTTLRRNQVAMIESLQLAYLSFKANTKITVRRVALHFLPKRLGRAVVMDGLAVLLYIRFEEWGAIPDLDEALALERNVLQLLPQGHPDRTTAMGNIAVFLHSHFEELGAFSDLEEALVFQRSALELYPQGHPDRATSMANLASCFLARFEQLGTSSDLEEALALQRNALELYPQGHPHRIISQVGLAKSLYARFEQLGALSDLDEALVLERDILKFRPQGHPARAESLGNIALYLHARFEELGTLADLDEAITLERTALEFCSQGDSDRAISLGNLAATIYTRFERLGSLSNLDEALTLERNALELRPQGHPDRAHSLGHLSFYLHARFEKLGTRSDLDEALAVAHDALELRSQGHPDRAHLLGTIVLCLYSRLKHSIHDAGDLQEILNSYSQLSDISHIVSFTVLRYGKRLIQAAEECKHSTTALAYRTFLHLIVQYLATLPSLPQHLAILKQLTTTTVVDGFSACIRYDNPTSAAELLEQGRGAFWSQLIRLRSPLEELRASGDSGKALADKFMQVAFLLRSALDVPPGVESQHDQTCRLNVQLQDIITEIRNLPGLSRFLQPPFFSDIRNAASGGPVVIVNASQYSCDALIILSEKDPIHVSLPVTRARVSELASELRSLTLRARFSEMTKEFLVFLRELWDLIVFPIVQILQEYCSRRSRIWWCPTAEFSLLPLHAAGPFRKGQPMLSDIYISSYTPTLMALVRARQKIPSGPSVDQPSFLIVGQAQAPGQCELVSVNTELSNISQSIGSIATLTCVQDQDATVAKVAEEFSKNEFVHLACHGLPNQKRPFESGFALGDGMLKVEDIMRYDLQDARFAYLSACHTTVGDKESPDEVIHLAAAMQFAGFRSVIGTMWAVDDAHTNEITSRFYSKMVDESGRLDHTRAALALHRTMNSLRSSKMPIDQRILYIHIGA